jgi:hypothetical protein
MLKQINSILLLSFLMTILMGLQCDKEYVAPPKQNFLEKVSLIPAQKVYNVNDTIWLRYITSNKTFLDQISRQRLPTNTIQFGFGAILLPKYSTPLNPTDGFCSFILPNNVTAKYVTSQSGTSTYFSIDCDNAAAYNIQLGVVLKYTGIYVLNLPDGITLEACSNETNPYTTARVQFIYNSSDCNKDIYLSIPDSARQEFPVGFTAAQIDYKVAYAFKVQ